MVMVNLHLNFRAIGNFFQELISVLESKTFESKTFTRDKKPLNDVLEGEECLGLRLPIGRERERRHGGPILPATKWDETSRGKFT